MRIHLEANGVAVNAISEHRGEDVNGYLYQVTSGSLVTTLSFWRGGISGVTNEALLVVLAHRLELLDEKLSCNENKLAIHYIKSALRQLNTRSANRAARGVEGKEEV